MVARRLGGQVKITEPVVQPPRMPLSMTIQESLPLFFLTDMIETPLSLAQLCCVPNGDSICIFHAYSLFLYAYFCKRICAGDSIVWVLRNLKVH